MCYSVLSVLDPEWFVVPVDYSLTLFTLYFLLFCSLNLFFQLHQLCKFQLEMTDVGVCVCVCAEFKRTGPSVTIHI
jgi:hypothetical protein